MSAVDVLAVMDAYSVPGQVCCGMPVGGGYDGEGNGEPPVCCGQPFNEGHMQEARAAVSELIEAAGDLDRQMEADWDARTLSITAQVSERITALRAALAEMGGKA